ncbi:esterase [Bradyrhizobium sp. 2TAF24]|uniref:esterase n=1 Tax=Bradyrhizobium sp. 2TAF24 TaxID=3233011 RepID=UPI003F8F760D
MLRGHLTAAMAFAAMLAASSARAEEPITLRAMGSFHVGGRLVELTGKPVKEMALTPGGVPARFDPNGTYQVEQMYVQYFLPAREVGTVPILFWHGGGMTGVNFETTPDGREGWLNMFVRKGWGVYVSDAVERGRASWAQYPDIFKGEPLFLTTSNPFTRFRIGDGPDSYDPDPARRRLLPGSQFPNDGYENFVKQIVPRWTTTDDATLAAYLAEIDRVCPCVILFHSQAGQFGFKAAQARPGKVKALVAVEPAGVGDPAKVDALKGIPTLMIYGDFIAEDARWPKIRASGVAFAEAIRGAGGHVDVVDLPAIGIKGNSHMMMMDRNNAEVAGVIEAWLAKNGLTRAP